MYTHTSIHTYTLTHTQKKNKNTSYVMTLLSYPYFLSRGLDLSSYMSMLFPMRSFEKGNANRCIQFCTWNKKDFEFILNNMVSTDFT